MKKFIFFAVIILTISILPLMLNADSLSNNEKARQELIAAAMDNGKVCDIFYFANNQKDSNQFLNITGLSGYVSPKELANQGGKYILQKLMTYKESCDLNYEDGISYDIDPDRVVWVIRTHFDQTNNLYNFEGITIRDVTVSSIWDAETGDAISVTIQSDDQSFKNAIAQRSPANIAKPSDN